MTAWEAIEQELSEIRPQTWITIEARLENVKPIIVDKIYQSQKDVAKVPLNINNGEALSQLLGNLNYYVGFLGELHAITKSLSEWTERRYSIEKGIEATRLIRDGKKSAAYAKEAQYETTQDFLDITVETGALHLRVQNARSTARDTNEGIRSRIGQLRGEQRSY